MIGGFMKEGNMDKIVETDIEFHDLLYQAARNVRLVGIIHNLREQLTRFRTLSMSYPGRLEATLDEHRTMVEAIASGDVRAAKRAAEKKNRDEMWLLIDENVGKRINDGLYLAGTGTDENSDFKVSQAIKKAELSSNARIVIYDRN